MLFRVDFTHSFTRRPIFVFLAAFLVLIPLASCTSKRQAINYPVPVIEPYKGEVTVDLLRRSAGFGDLKSLSSLVKVRIYKNGEPEGSVSGIMAFRNPGDLRVSLFGPFSLTAMELLITKDFLQVYVPTKNIIYKWQSPYLSLSPATDSVLNYEMEDRGDILALLALAGGDVNGVPAVTYLFDRQFILNRTIVVHREGDEMMAIGFSDFHGKVPWQMKVSFRGGQEMEIRLDDPEYNAEIPDAYFRSFEGEGISVIPFQEFLSRLAPLR